MSNSSTKWWQRSGNYVAYPCLKQGSLPHCVYAAIAGGVNHLAQSSVWTPQSLFDEYQKDGPKDAHFGVAEPAIVPVSDQVEKHHHLKGSATESLAPELIRSWIDEGGVVILSMELRNDSVSGRGGWHMFSLVSYKSDYFQVWDTNGGQVINGIAFEGRGFLTEDEIMNGFYYPNGWFFMPHDNEDTLVLKRKK